MRIVAPIGHAEAIQSLWRAARAGRLPHALGLFGTRGIGKFTAGLWFVQGLLCEDGPAIEGGRSSEAPCGECSACRQLTSGTWYGNHTDFLRMDPLEYAPPQKRRSEGEDESKKKALSTILYPDIRLPALADRSVDDFDERMNLARFVDRMAAGPTGRRVVLIRESERLTEASQNALLKTLEEPPRGVLLILECSLPERFLPTVRSRLTEVWLQPLGEADVETVLDLPGPLRDALAKQPDVPRETWVRLCEGAPGRLWQALREGHLELLEAWRDLLTGAATPFAAVERLFEARGDFAGATPKQQERTRARAALDLLGQLLESGWREATGLGESAAKPLGVARPELQWRRSLEQTWRARADLGLNIDPRTCLERAALGAVGDPGWEGVRA
jgi:hypothetical protein